jgi:hypothetical protein
MPTRNKIILGGLACIVLCGLFPPWINVLDVPYHAHNKTPAGYGFIFSPPAAKGGAWGIEIDGNRLLIEWVCIAAVTGVILVLVVNPAWSHDNNARRLKKFIPPPGNPEN